MSIADILASIDEQIATLQQARAVLAGDTKRGRGRPKGSATVGKPAIRKRNVSPEGRARIAEAVKARWARQKKAAKA